MNDIATDSDGLQLDELQQQLAEKEQVISALTAQLEQAADELDRRHRSGMDRGMKVGGGGVPAELIEQQKSITEELQAAVQRWEDMQAALTLGRLEMQLTEIRDLIVAQPEGRARGEAPKSSTNKSSGSAKKEDPKPKDTGSGWESIKSRYMIDSEDERSDDDSTENSAAEESRPDAVDEPSTVAREYGRDTCDVPIQDWEVEIPEPVDFESADLEALREAVDVRDKFIVEMTRRLRSLPVHMPPRDWEGLASAPDELQQELEDVLTRYDEKLRCAEVELSLERARLGREEARLTELKELLEKQQKRMGNAAANILPPNDGYEDNPDTTNKSSLWRLLSKK